MKNMKNIYSALLVAFLFATSSVFAQGITFTFGNGQISGSGPYYYSIVVLAQADGPNTFLGDTQLYINYSNLAFEDSAAANGKVSLSRGTLLIGESGGNDLYSWQNLVDHDKNRIAITYAYNFDSSPTLGNPVPETPTGLMTIRFEIANRAWQSGLSFEESLMQGQQFLSDNFIQFSPVTAVDTDDAVLGVESIESTSIPTEFKMHQNYPNPFNPETTVRFELQANLGGENVTLVVYDMLGR